jgi:CDP-diacylglycerol--glycerol-3-phosphate 3-phosphatidyltransferase
MLAKEKNYLLAACILYHIGAFTDFLDGWLARKLNSTSEWGVFLDPLADKFLTGSAFVSFVALGLANVWMVAIIIFRDVFTTMMRIVADKAKKPMVTSWSAKVKTFLQMVYISGIIIALTCKQSSTNVLANSCSEYVLKPEVLFYALLALTGLTVWTTVEYVIDNKSLFSEIGKKNK